MKRPLFIFACIVAFISASAFSGFAADLKIGVIDTQRIFMESKKNTEYRSRLSKELEIKNQEFLKKRNDLQELYNELRDQSKNMDQKVLIEKRDDLQQKEKELKRMQEEIEAEIKVKDTEMKRSFSQKIQEAAEEYLKKENFSLILEKGIILSYDNAIDITDQLMKLYDSKP